MKLSKLYSKSLWKDSFLYAVSFIAAIETICAIANFSITDICNIGTVVKFRHYESIGRLSR